jgi:hypothetical protein
LRNELVDVTKAWLFCQTRLILTIQFWFKAN